MFQIFPILSGIGRLVEINETTPLHPFKDATLYRISMSDYLLLYRVKIALSGLVGTKKQRCCHDIS